MNKIIFFAQIRETIGVSQLELDVNMLSVEALITQLSHRGDNWSLALSEHTILCAVNQSLVDHHYIIQSGDEIAFFPPVTGG